MIDIDYIMALLDDRKSTEEQSKGLEMAKSIKCIRGFVMPKSIRDHQYYWENCARVLAGKTDDELKPFLLELFNWIRNMDNPGANIILQRLKEFKNDQFFLFTVNEYKKIAEVLCDDSWAHSFSLISGSEE